MELLIDLVSPRNNELYKRTLVPVNQTEVRPVGSVLLPAEILWKDTGTQSWLKKQWIWWHWAFGAFLRPLRVYSSLSKQPMTCSCWCTAWAPPGMLWQLLFISCSMLATRNVECRTASAGGALGVIGVKAEWAGLRCKHDVPSGGKQKSKTFFILSIGKLSIMTDEKQTIK